MLTDREKEILRSLAQHDFINKQVADALVLAPSTVKNHIASIKTKLQKPNKASAYVKAKELGLI